MSRLGERRIVDRQCLLKPLKLTEFQVHQLNVSLSIKTVEEAMIIVGCQGRNCLAEHFESKQ